MKQIWAQFKNEYLNERSVRKSFVLFFIIACGILIDQYIKFFIFAEKFSSGLITHFKNYQFAFSIPLPIWMIYFLYIVVLAVAARILFKKFAAVGKLELIGWGLLFAGGLSNLGERILLGYVRDYFLIFNGIFNLADFFIIVGILILILLPPL